MCWHQKRCQVSKGVQDRCRFSVVLPTTAYLSEVEARGLLDKLFLLVGTEISESSYTSDLHLLGPRQWLASAPRVHCYLLLTHTKLHSALSMG